MPAFINLTGRSFGRLTVTENFKKVKDRTHWLCRCKCGKEKWISNSSLGRSTNSCGCLEQETRNQFGVQALTHGFSPKSSGFIPEYNIWASMKGRCKIKTDTNYPKYGARGIRVCDSWLNSFENFLADMGRRPSNLHSIERNDYNGNYEPSNCRWATRKEQARNKRNVRLIEFRGETKCLVEWAELLGIASATLSQRFKNGWTVEEAFTRAVDKRKCSHRSRG